MERRVRPGSVWTACCATLMACAAWLVMRSLGSFCCARDHNLGGTEGPGTAAARFLVPVPKTESWQMQLEFCSLRTLTASSAAAQYAQEITKRNGCGLRIRTAHQH